MGLLYLSPLRDNSKSLVAHCDQFDSYFTDKIDSISFDLDSRNWSIDLCKGVQHVLWDAFQIVRSKDMDRIFGGVWTTSCESDCHPSWLIKAAGRGLLGWLSYRREDCKSPD